MKHHPVAHINPHMGHRAGAVIGSREKDNVAGLCLGGRNDSTLVVNALRRGTGQVVDAAGRVHPADKARTVKGGGRAGAAPHIGPADVLCGFFHERRKSRVIQRLAGYLIAGAGIFAAVVNPFPQIGFVAFELLHNGVDFPLLFVKPRQDHGGQRFVCEGHIENVILIGDFLGGGFPGLRVGAGFGAVAYLDFLRQGQLILCLEDLPQFVLHLFPEIHMVLCREIGRQLIGVMADLVHGIAVLVIAGMGAFDVRYRLRQLVFQCRVVLVHAQQVRILRGVGGAG